MTIARGDIVKTGEVAVYHCVSRCVRRAYLCGYDKLTKKNFDHRRGWLLERIKFLLSIFSVEVLSYALMSNHSHLMVRTTWEKLGDEEAARRWLTLYPEKSMVNEDGSITPNPAAIRTLLKNKKMMEAVHQRLSSLSWFMKSINEYLAVRSNREDDCKGRFWEGRFKCTKLKGEASLMACSAYIDLNPVRAGLAGTPEESCYTSAWTRIQALTARDELKRLGSAAIGGKKHSALRARARLDEWLAPIDVREGSGKGFLSVSTEEYLTMLDWTGREIRADKRGAVPSHLAPILSRLEIRPERWLETTCNFGSLFYRIVGCADTMAESARALGLSWLRGVSAARAAFTSG